MNVERIIIHHSASHPGSTTRELIDFWHRERGFKRVGYHFVLEGGGELREGRPAGEIGAHCRGYNDTSIGLCVTGDNTNTDPDYHWRPIQKDALVEAILLLREQHGAGLPVVRHCDLANTLCPGLPDDDWNILRARWGDGESDNHAV